ncbi:MAG: hypothetical protein SNI87_08130 [Rikenellaceae bacterium]
MAKNRVKQRGHYCRICGELKSNESFSGKGHARHICKKCAALPLDEREEMGRMENLMRVVFKFPKSRKDWEIIERYAASNKDQESSRVALEFLEEHSSHYRSKVAARKSRIDSINK